MKTVSITTISETRKEIAKIHQCNIILAEKLLSHFVIMNNVTGIETVAEINTSIRLLFRKEYIIARPEQPKIFLIPISLVLVLAINRVRPNKPKAAIRIEKIEKIVTMVVRFFSDE